VILLVRKTDESAPVDLHRVLSLSHEFPHDAPCSLSDLLAVVYIEAELHMYSDLRLLHCAMLFPVNKMEKHS
jgi:hypothetical protein